MTVILFVRCDASETFGVAPAAVQSVGARVEVWDALDGASPRPILDGIDGIVVFGSTFNVGHADEQPFIEETAGVIREALDRRIPFLGVCFGGQLLAWALDAKVGEGPTREIGFEPIHPTDDASHDRLFSHLSDGDLAFQWHGDAFELPAGATLLATGDRVPNQAFRVGELAWGTQFHCEVNLPELDFWLDEFAKEGDLRSDWGKSSQEVRDEAGRFMAAHESRGREVFERFTTLAAGE
ncbi:MAG TPA: type 1 glutamine amidotransferase [Actinomycetota bacterium]|nr:type 1 glutamine amidotransferase [Actinomycetota bacterium]